MRGESGEGAYVNEGEGSGVYTNTDAWREQCGILFVGENSFCEYIGMGLPHNDGDGDALFSMLGRCLGLQ